MKKKGFTLLLLISTIVLLFFSCQRMKNDKESTPVGASPAYIYQKKADDFLEKNIHDSAYFNYLQSNRELLLLKDTSNIAYNYIQISEIQLFVGDVIGAEETCIEALKYVPQSETPYLIAIYNNIGRCYRKLFNDDKAIEYYNKALHLETDTLNKSILQNNIAYTYLKNGQYNEALNILTALIESDILKKNPLQYARSLDNLGNVLFKTNPTLGLPELQHALYIRDSLQYEHGLVESYSNLSQYYSNTNQGLAQNYALQMYQLAKKLKNPDDELQALNLLLKNSNSNALRLWSEKYIDLSNSISKARQTAKNEFAKIKYDYQKETAENLELKTKTTKQELDIERETNRRQVLLFILITLIVAVILFIRYNRRRHKEEKAKQIYITETKISKKIHDELANDIYNIVAFTENFDLSETNHKNRLLIDLEKAYNKTRNISSEYGSISMGNDFSNYLKGLLQEYNGKNVKIVSVGIDAIDWNTLAEVKKIAIYRVLQELLVNMKKHSQANLVSLKFEPLKGQLKISYSDNGTGIINEKLIAKNGLINAENRIKDIQGSFTFETEINKGLKIFITIPV